MIIRRIEKITESILKDLNITKVENIKTEKIAKFLGIDDIQPEKLSHSISGFFVQENKKNYIRYNKNEVEERQRFTIAHELGHFILHKNKSLSVIKQGVLYRDDNSSSGEVKKEREANAFAAALLMPSKLIAKEIDKAPSASNVNNAIAYLADRFRVSEQAMMFRLMNLGYRINGSY